MGRSVGCGKPEPSHSRRYHALLTAAVNPPVDRVIVLHSLIDQVLLNDYTVDLATLAFASPEGTMLHPNGHQHLFTQDITPPHHATWRYRIPEAQHITASGPQANDAKLICRSVRLLCHRNAVEISWSLTTDVSHGDPAVLRVRPLMPLRDFHGLSCCEEPPPTVTRADTRTLLVRRDRLCAKVTISRGQLTIEPQWWRNFVYDHDAKRGQDCREDVWSPGVCEATLGVGDDLTMRVELIAPALHDLPPADTGQFAVQASAADMQSDAPVAQRLRSAADQFIVQRYWDTNDERDRWTTSIIAGYPWFADWGRDAMISIPGLLLCNSDGHYGVQQATSCLLTFARSMRHGLIPNRFDDYGASAHFNTVDAPLWFVHAVHTLSTRDGVDNRLTQELFAACKRVIDAYRHGINEGIAMDDDGLIRAGSPQTQLTWMDAQRNGVTFTPRHGKAVEVNALWHHALHCMADLVTDSRAADELRTLARRVAVSMSAAFWNAKRACCYDVLSPEGSNWVADDAIRPNQIFAVSLHPSPLSTSQQRGIVTTVRDRLLTPYGLRTLEPGHHSYHGRYEGDLMQRDAAYHQGTVWPWLIGPYAEAALRVDNFSEAAKAHVRTVIRPLTGTLETGCYNQIAEVFDGDAPHRPSGCPAQAWSVAEVRRILDMLDAR